MRRAWVLAFLAVGGCAKQEPERGVDTTLPSVPAKITGSISAPNEYLPEDLAVCAETVDGRTAYCDAEISKGMFAGTYSLKVPPGSYRVFSRTGQVPNYKAYFSACTSASECPSHDPIVVKVDEGEERSGVDPVDWFNRPAASTPSNEGYGDGYGTTDMNVDENLTTTNMDDTGL